MKNSKRSEMLRTLEKARMACFDDCELCDLGRQISRAVNYLILLVAGSSKKRRYDVVDTGRLCSPEMPYKERLQAVEDAVRDVWADFEAAAALDNPDLTLGDRMVMEAVDDAVWMIGGMWDEATEADDESGRQG